MIEIKTITNRIKKTIFIFIASAYLLGCSTVKKVALDRDVGDILKRSEIFSKHFTGFSLFDIETNEYIADHNSTFLFTPASNTKILTTYVTLKSFADSIPGIFYAIKDEELVVIPSGDPTFLHPDFQNQPVYELLKKHRNISVNWPDDDLKPYGPGWAWDDYSEDFQAHITWWPIYGNSISIEKEDTLQKIQPEFFADFVEIGDTNDASIEVERDWKHNLFSINMPKAEVELDKSIPFEYSQQLFSQLLADTLKKAKISFTETELIQLDTIYSQPIDSVLAKMMKPSSNFLAEQLLLMAAQKNGYASTKQFIKYVKAVWLSDLNEMVWVDGSGLSRYNLIAPVDQVRLLKKCYDEFGWDRLKAIFPKGGQGTLEDLYIDESPYVYAKTGTLSNNHNLSGFLEAKSGKRLIFSFMNNHYVSSKDEIELAMQEFLNKIRDSY